MPPIVSASARLPRRYSITVPTAPMISTGEIVKQPARVEQQRRQHPQARSADPEEAFLLARDV